MAQNSSIFQLEPNPPSAFAEIVADDDELPDLGGVFNVRADAGAGIIITNPYHANGFACIVG